jgi:hypothetical protein
MLKAQGPMLNAQRAFVLALLLVLPVPQASTQPGVASITTPPQQFGASIGDDYFLATYTQLEDYWKKLDRQSDRLQLVGHRTNRGGPRPVDGDHLVTREPEAARSLSGYFPAAVAG